MKLVFTKMQALGNDFVVIDATKEHLELLPEQAALLADRHFGVGCDQVLVVDSSSDAEVDFGYRIFNADGSEVGQCGNGARCFAKFVLDKGLTNKHTIRVKTLSGVMQLKISQSRDWVTVDMGKPIFEAQRVPINLPQADLYTLELEQTNLEFSALSMGNPHAVLVVGDVATAPVEQWGPKLEHHPVFIQRANISFMQVVDSKHIALRVFERGAGETLACGSGACAAVVAGIKRGLLDSTVTVRLPGGELEVTWLGEGQTVMMSGPATTVFEGEIVL